jgi:hypothetical protein
MAAQLGLIEHVQQGNGSLRHFFDEPANQASAHWWVSRTGAIEQYIDSDLRSWAQMAGNATYCSVETEGWGRDPLTEPQVNALARLYRWGLQVHGWPYQLANRPGERGFGVHYMGGKAWGGHPCPLPTRAAQRGRILELAQGGIPNEGDDDMAMTDAQSAALVKASELSTRAEQVRTISACYRDITGRAASDRDMAAFMKALDGGLSIDAWYGQVVRAFAREAK